MTTANGVQIGAGAVAWIFCAIAVGAGWAAIATYMKRGPK